MLTGYSSGHPESLHQAHTAVEEAEVKAAAAEKKAKAAAPSKRKREAAALVAQHAALVAVADSLPQARHALHAFPICRSMAS